MKEEEAQKCRECGENLLAHLVEVYNLDVEVGGFCDNERCEMYLIIVT